MEINSQIQNIIDKHKSAFENWEEGEPVKVWTDENGATCIKYESGHWWHYKYRNNHLEWW